jgi:hypothetical protein
VLRPRPRGALLAYAVALWLAAPAPSRAQLIPAVDAGVSTVRFTGYLRSTAATLTPSLQLDRPWSSARATGSIARFESGRVSMNGLLSGSAFTPAGRGLRGELSATAGASTYEESRSAQLLGQARVHLHADTLGGWLGAGTGYARYNDYWQPITLLDAGGWARLRGILVSASLSSAAYTFRDSIIEIRTDPISGLPDTSLQFFRRSGYFTDVVAGARWSIGRFDLDLTAGVRPIARFAEDTRWGTASATAWLADGLALVGSAGDFPEDPLQNLAGASYVSLALRIGGRARVGRPVPAREKPAGPGMASEFSMTPADGGTQSVVVRARGARRVEITGGFTDWQPVVLARIAAELWMVTLPIAPGTYDLALRIDGGAWMPPPGVPVFEDEFSGRVGRIVVPAPDDPAPDDSPPADSSG